MSEYKNLLYSFENGVTTITFNRPKALNALNKETLEEFDAALSELSECAETKVVVITGSGDKSFIAGADIKEMASMSAVEGRIWGKFGQAVFEKLEKLEQPVIAAVNGFALGGGCELAMACDIRISAENAKFGQPEVTLGITPGFGGTQRLPRLVGRAVAKELIYTGDIISAEEAYRIGLVNKVVKQEELLNTVYALAKKIASRAEVAVKLSKAAINAGEDMAIEKAIAYEAEVFGLCFATEDQKEGMNAFTEKRPANFTGK